MFNCKIIEFSNTPKNVEQISRNLYRVTQLNNNTLFLKETTVPGNYEGQANVLAVLTPSQARNEFGVTIEEEMSLKAGVYVNRNFVAVMKAKGKHLSAIKNDLNNNVKRQGIIENFARTLANDINNGRIHNDIHNKNYVIDSKLKVSRIDFESVTPLSEYADGLDYTLIERSRALLNLIDLQLRLSAEDKNIFIGTFEKALSPELQEVLRTPFPLTQLNLHERGAIALSEKELKKEGLLNSIVNLIEKNNGSAPVKNELKINASLSDIVTRYQEVNLTSKVSILRTYSISELKKVQRQLIKKKPVEIVKTRKSYIKKLTLFTTAVFGASIVLPALMTGTFSGAEIVRNVFSVNAAALKFLGWADLSAVAAGKVWTLSTAMFLHGGLLHFGFNMSWLKSIGKKCNQEIGRHNTISAFLISGVIGNAAAVLTPVLMNSLFNTQMLFNPIVGASGAIFGLMGAFIAANLKHKESEKRKTARTQAAVATAIIGLGFFIPYVSNIAHIAGLASGLLLGRVLPEPTTASKRLTAKRIFQFTAGLSASSAVFMLLNFI
jgi:membrane associated rhomboid family serine protease